MSVFPLNIKPTLGILDLFLPGAHKPGRIQECGNVGASHTVHSHCYYGRLLLLLHHCYKDRRHDATSNFYECCLMVKTQTKKESEIEKERALLLFQNLCSLMMNIHC